MKNLFKLLSTGIKVQTCFCIMDFKSESKSNFTWTEMTRMGKKSIWKDWNVSFFNVFHCNLQKTNKIVLIVKTYDFCSTHFDIILKRDFNLILPLWCHQGRHRTFCLHHCLPILVGRNQINLNTTLKYNNTFSLPVHPEGSCPQAPHCLQPPPSCPVVVERPCLDCRAQWSAHSLPLAGCLLSGSLTSS